MNNQSNVIRINFAANKTESRTLGISMMKSRRQGKFVVHTNLAKLTHQEFFHEMIRSAIMLEKEMAIKNSIS